MTATDRSRRQSTTDHAGRPARIEAVRSAVEASYTATHARLATDPEYQRLTADAEDEARHAPSQYFARNHLAIYVETQMPPITRSPDG